MMRLVVSYSGLFWRVHFRGKHVCGYMSIPMGWMWERDQRRLVSISMCNCHRHQCTSPELKLTCRVSKISTLAVVCDITYIQQKWWLTSSGKGGPSCAKYSIYQCLAATSLGGNLLLNPCYLRWNPVSPKSWDKMFYTGRVKDNI